jgi:hypothetical protein
VLRVEDSDEEHHDDPEEHHGDRHHDLGRVKVTATATKEGHDKEYFELIESEDEAWEIVGGNTPRPDAARGSGDAEAANLKTNPQPAPSSQRRRWPAISERPAKKAMAEAPVQVKAPPKGFQPPPVAMQVQLPTISKAWFCKAPPKALASPPAAAQAPLCKAPPKALASPPLCKAPPKGFEAPPVAVKAPPKGFQAPLCKAPPMALMAPTPPNKAPPKEAATTTEEVEEIYTDGARQAMTGGQVPTGSYAGQVPSAASSTPEPPTGRAIVPTAYHRQHVRTVGAILGGIYLCAEEYLHRFGMLTPRAQFGEDIWNGMLQLYQEYVPPKKGRGASARFAMQPCIEAGWFLPPAEFDREHATMPLGTTPSEQRGERHRQYPAFFMRSDNENYETLCFAMLLARTRNWYVHHTRVTIVGIWNQYESRWESIINV